MKTNRTVIVQCRLSSTRLPGKALKEAGGKTVLAWVLSSMKKVIIKSQQMKPLMSSCFQSAVNMALNVLRGLWMMFLRVLQGFSKL